MDFIETYLKEINIKAFSGKGVIEATYYTALENLINNIATELKLKIEVVAQPSVAREDKSGIARPDFAIYKDNLLFGIIEAKDYKNNIDNLKNSDQVKKYAELTNNILLTNFVDFELLTYTDSDKIISEKFNLSSDKEKAYNLIKKLLLAEVPPIKNKNNLLKLMVFGGKYIRDELVKEFKNGNPKYIDLKKHIYNDMDSSAISDEIFCDNYTELIVFSLLFSKIEQLENDSYKLGNLPILKEWLKLFNDLLEVNIVLKNEYNRLFKIIDSIDISLLINFKNIKTDDFQNLYTHFYVEFLNQYDKNTKQAYGVYYTDKSISNFINRCIDNILVEKFNLLGLHDENVELLDFATGSGTFIEEALRIALNKDDFSVQEKEEKRKNILKRFYGFEIMMSSYILCLFKLNLLIKEEFKIKLSDADSKEFMPAIFLTNTLNPTYGDSISNNRSTTSNYNVELTAKNFIMANAIKQSDKLLVIEGNPPYKNGSALNRVKKTKENKDNKGEFKSISKIMQEYKPTGEITIKHISDDYIRFIAFAQTRIRETKQGIVGIITNHGFLSGITFRKMRETLLNDFDEIYILNLHGNLRTTLANGDANVFEDIKQGVCISLFIKTYNWGKGTKGKVFYYDLRGSKQSKFDFLNNNLINTIDFEDVKYQEFDKAIAKTKWGETLGNLHFFTPKDYDLMKEYGNFWGLKDIFNDKNISSGVITTHDDVAISFSEEDGKSKINDLLTMEESKFREKYPKKGKPLVDSRDWKYACAKKDAEANINNKPWYEINYRPFDKRIVWHSKENGINVYPRKDLISNLSINKNIGLCFTRFATSSDKFKHVFITNKISEAIFLSSKGSETSYIAPLYILDEIKIDKDVTGKKQQKLNLSEEPKTEIIPNFTDNFTNNFINKLSFKPTSEDIMSYIYAILNTPEYRKTYGEYLSIDYPRVFFTTNEECFNQFKNLGEALTKAHTLDDNFIRTLSINTYKNETEILYNNLKTLQDKDIVKNDILAMFTNDIKEYTIGSYEVIDKYLSYRKDMPLTNEIITHLVNMFVAISESLAIEKELDTAWIHIVKTISD